MTLYKNQIHGIVRRSYLEGHNNNSIYKGWYPQN